MSLIVTILLAGCGKEEALAKEDSSAEETPSDDTSEIEEKESEFETETTSLYADFRDYDRPQERDREHTHKTD